MSDLYLEELVKRRKTGTDQALRYVLMALTAIGVVLSLLTWNLIIIAVSIAICVADIFIFPRFQTEWEYQYVNGELDVDRIINKAKRKRMASYGNHIDQAGTQRVGKRVHIIDHANQDFAVRTRIEIAERQRLNMRENIAAHVFQHELTDASNFDGTITQSKLIHHNKYGHQPR